MKRALILAAALVLLPVPASAEMGDLMAAADFAEHVTEATGAFPDDITAFETWADEEQEWLLANPPLVCFAETWGLWLLTVEGARLSGIVADTLDTLALTAITDATLEWGALMVESLDGLTERCAA